MNDAGAWQTPLMYMFREREKHPRPLRDDLRRAPDDELHAHRWRRLRSATRVPPGRSTRSWPRCRTASMSTPSCWSTTRSCSRATRRRRHRSRPEDAINASLDRPHPPRVRCAMGPAEGRALLRLRPYYDLRDPGRTAPGTAYDRFMVRLEEMRQSQSPSSGRRSTRLPSGPHKTTDPARAPPRAGRGLCARRGSSRRDLASTSSPMGGSAPYRFHIRAPSLINLSLLK